MHAQPRSRKPFTNLSTNANSALNAPPQRPHPNANKTHTDILSHPFRHSLNITPKPLLSHAPKQNAKADYDEDDDLKKPLHLIHTKSSSPHKPSSNNSSKSSTASLPQTPKICRPSHSNTPSATQSTSQSLSTSASPSPGVLKNKQNIPSPQRIPTISLRSFHTLNHVEFYKPIPISQSRSTQFEIINETYNHKSIQIKKKKSKNDYISCIDILPTAIELKRYETCIITVTCTPIQPMRIKEVIAIEWDSHSIEVHVHAIGFTKNISKHKKHRQRGYRKRSLSNMRQEDTDKCNSVQSSLESSGSNSSKNSARLQRRKRRSRRPMLSPTIRREKTFTAAPFASPAPNKLRRNFVFDKGNNSNALSVVLESGSFSPKFFKKRRLIQPENPSQNKEIQQFEQLCAQKKCQQLIQCNKMKGRQLQRERYYFGVIKSQLMSKRVRGMYLNYKNAAIVIQSSFKTYCMKKKYNEYMAELQKKEEERQQELLHKQREEQIRLKQERESALTQYLMCMIHCKRARHKYKNMQHCSIVLQSFFKTYIAQKKYHQKRNGLILIQSYIRTKICRYKYFNILQQTKIQKQRREREKKQCMLWLISLWRMRKFRTKLAEKRRYIAMTNNAATYIQSWFVGAMYRRTYIEYQLKERQRKRNEASVSIQSWFKGSLYRKKYIDYMRYQRKKQCVLSLVSLWRMNKFRSMVDEKRRCIAMRNNAASYIQSWFVGAMYRRIYIEFQHEENQRKRNEATVYIQSWFKGTMNRKKYIKYMRYQRKKQCVLSLVSLWRMHKFRKKLAEKRRYIAMQNNAASYIQSWFVGVMYRRMYLQYQHEEKQRNEASICIQSWFKGSICRKKYIHYMRHQRKKQCVLSMLSLWRMHKFRSMVDEKRRYIAMRNNAASYIQSWFVGAMYRRIYIEYQHEEKQRKRNEATVYIQSWFKGTMNRKKYIKYMRYQRKKKCVLSLVSLWRMHKFRSTVDEKRRYIAMRNNAASYIQSWFVGAMYKRRYMEYKRQNKAGYIEKVIKVQAVTRGKLLRMECAQNEELQKIVRKVHNAHKNWKKELTVNYLLEDALSKLSKSRTLYGVSESCDTLCCLLKIVPNISNRIVEHNIIGSLYKVLRNSNRSLPHLNLVNKILTFFLFFAKHDVNCYKAIFHRDDTLDILSERLQIHRLDFVLFELTTELFFVGVHTMYDDSRQHNKFLINLRQSDVNRQVRTVQKIMCSKLEIAKRVNKPLRKMNNAKVKYKIKFQQERILQKCVQNINKLVDNL